MPGRATPQQQAIERAIERAGRPLSPAEVHTAAQHDVPSLSMATVYRGIKRLLDDERIHTVELPGHPPRYETAAAAREHHHHFHCTACDRVYDVDGCVSGIDRLAPNGFAVTDHEITLYGVCPKCQVG